MQIVPSGDNLQEVSDPIINLSSAESAHSRVNVDILASPNNLDMSNYRIRSTELYWIPQILAHQGPAIQSSRCR